MGVARETLGVKIMAAVVKKWCVTDPVAEAVVFDWTIENVLIQCCSGRSLKSSCFSSKAAKWFLTIHKETNGSYVSIYVSRTFFNMVVDVFAGFKVSIGEEKTCFSHVKTFGECCGMDNIPDDVADEDDSDEPLEPYEMSSYGFREYILYKDSYVRRPMAATCPSMFQELGSIWMSTCLLVSIFQLEKEKHVCLTCKHLLMAVVTMSVMKSLMNQMRYQWR